MPTGPALVLEKKGDPGESRKHLQMKHDNGKRHQDGAYEKSADRRSVV